MIYRITYPNGKIYIGSDTTDSINYFGSASSELIARDFTRADRQSFSVTRDILWEAEAASDSEVRRREVELIREHGSNTAGIGYNQTPRRGPLDKGNAGPRGAASPTTRSAGPT